MRFTAKILFVLVAFIFPLSAHAESKTLSVDITASKVGWIGKKVAGPHNGTVNISQGSVTLEDGKFTGGSFVLDMTSIKDLDIESDEWRAKLENHLKSDDFFAVSSHPTAKFTISEIAKTDSANSYTVKGQLTIKNITHEISFPATIVEKAGQYVAQAQVKIDRLKWNIKYNSASFFDVQKLGDKLIYDEIQIDLHIVAG